MEGMKDAREEGSEGMGEMEERRDSILTCCSPLLLSSLKKCYQAV